MTRVEEPLRCLAVRVVLDDEGQVDGIELETYLNAMAGRHQWLSTTEWLFTEPPVQADGQMIVPVLMPELVALRAIVKDMTADPQRIVHDHQTSAEETRKWRWVAFQIAPNRRGHGYFPWEQPVA